MSRKAVYCIATGRDQGEQIVRHLRAAGASGNDISVLFPDKPTTWPFAHEKGANTSEGATVGATPGGLVGGALGWLAGVGALAIPGIGPFVAAGPIIAALNGSADGATTGGIAEGLIGFGFGFDETEARRYEGRLKAGNVLISVHSRSSGEITRARRIFSDAGAEDIRDTGESSSAEKSGTPGDRPSAAPAAARADRRAGATGLEPLSF